MPSSWGIKKERLSERGSPGCYVDQSTLTEKEMPARGKGFPLSRRKPEECNPATPKTGASRTPAQESSRQQDRDVWCFSWRRMCEQKSID